MSNRVSKRRGGRCKREEKKGGAMSRVYLGGVTLEGEAKNNKACSGLNGERVGPTELPKNRAKVD